MKPSSFSDAEFASTKKLTRCDRFLAEIEAATSWTAPVGALLLPTGREIDVDVRRLAWNGCCACLSPCGAFGLSDKGIEDAIDDNQAIRVFVGIDLTHESAPDATTLLKFRRLLENNKLTCRIFDEINGHLASKGLPMRQGTLIDTTLIAALASAKNRDGERDPEMHPPKMGNDWHFGMKALVGVEMTTGWSIPSSTRSATCPRCLRRMLLHGGEKAAQGAREKGSGKVAAQKLNLR